MTMNERGKEKRDGARNQDNSRKNSSATSSIHRSIRALARTQLSLRFLFIYFFLFSSPISSPSSAQKLITLVLKNKRVSHTRTRSSTLPHQFSTLFRFSCSNAADRQRVPSSHKRLYTRHRAASRGERVCGPARARRSGKKKNSKSKVPWLVIHRRSAPAVRGHYLRVSRQSELLIRPRCRW